MASRFSALPAPLPSPPPSLQELLLVQGPALVLALPLVAVGRVGRVPRARTHQHLRGLGWALGQPLALLVGPSAARPLRGRVGSPR